MLINPSHIAIVKWTRGWVAHLRFDNPKHDIDISSHSKYYLYRLIEAHWSKINETR